MRQRQPLITKLMYYHFGVGDQPRLKPAALLENISLDGEVMGVSGATPLLSDQVEGWGSLSRFFGFFRL